MTSFRLAIRKGKAATRLHEPMMTTNTAGKET